MRVKSFNRRELKFIIRTDQMQPFLDAITPFLKRDSNLGQAKTYRITSLYYDTEDYKAYWQKIEGVKHRRKLRIRVYGDHAIAPEEECFVEIKERVDQAVRKRRIIIPYEDARTMCAAGYLDERFYNDVDTPVIEEIIHLQQMLQLRPAVILRYDRQAYNGHPDYDPSLRITFDTNLRGRIHDLDLSTSTPEEMSIFFSPQLCILEVKADDRVPYWLVEYLHRHEFMLQKISKYCTALENLKLHLQRQSYVLPASLPERRHSRHAAADEISEERIESAHEPQPVEDVFAEELTAATAFAQSKHNGANGAHQAESSNGISYEANGHDTAQALTAAYNLIESAGDLTNAATILEDILLADPENIDGWWLYAHAITDIDKARIALENVLRLDAGYPGAQELLEQLEQQATTSQNGKQPSAYSAVTAESNKPTVIVLPDVRPANVMDLPVNMLLFAGRRAFENSDIKSARKLLRIAVSKEPHNEEVLLALLEIVVDKHKRLKLAEKLLALDHNSALARSIVAQSESKG